MSNERDALIALKRLFKRIRRRCDAAFAALKGRIVSIGPALRYRRSPYRASTGRTYRALRRSKGAYGEYLLSDRLRGVAGKWLFNVYLPKKEETTEIDALFVSKKGVFVFESKNFTGRIYGSVASREWYWTTVTAKGVIKHRFFNPLMQNGAHKRALCALVGQEENVFPVVVFGRNAKLMAAPEEYDESELTTLSGLRALVKKRPDVLSEKRIEKLYAQLSPYTEVSAKEKERHLEYAKKKSRRS